MPLSVTQHHLPFSRPQQRFTTDSISTLYPWLVPMLPGIEEAQKTKPVKAIEFFCGLGGLSLSFELVGGTLVFCVNHDRDAINSHQLNFQHANHWQASVEDLVMSDLPDADFLIGSPECTYQARSHGLPLSNQRSYGGWTDRHQMSAAEQSRASMWAMYYALKEKRVQCGLFENVVEAATLWGDYQEWKEKIEALGYEFQEVFLNARHMGVAQSRDRYMGVVTHKDLPRPDLDIRPQAYCTQCDLVGGAIQTWKPGKTSGYYGIHYTYHCPNCNQDVLPFYRPAAVFLDYADRGVVIRDRSRHGLPPLCAKTLQRIQMGIERFFSTPQRVPLQVYGLPENLPVPDTLPFWTKYNSNGKAYSIFDPICTVSSRDRCALVFPPLGWTFEMGLPKLQDCSYRMLSDQEVQRAMCLEPLTVAKASTTVRQCGLAVAPPHAIVPLWRCMQILRKPGRKTAPIIPHLGVLHTSH